MRTGCGIIVQRRLSGHGLAKKVRLVNQGLQFGHALSQASSFAVMFELKGLSKAARANMNTHGLLGRFAIKKNIKSHTCVHLLSKSASIFLALRL